jgi:ribosomal protein S18 acetylase RimI-like enzyme
VRPSSLALATLIDVLPLDSVVDRRDGYLVVRSPSNPTHYWGNLLVFDQPPGEGDGAEWERLFEAEFADAPRVRHHTFAWDRTDGDAGRASEEFVARGYNLEDQVGLIAAPAELRPHPRENREVLVRPLDPDADEQLWDGVVELQVANRDPQHTEDTFRTFTGTRLDDLRAHFRLRRGAWYVALADGNVVASCGVVVTGERGRFQAVDTAEAYRRRGICSRLVVEAAHRTAETYGAERFVIVADAGYHALGLYESLGFSRVEHVFGVYRAPHTP